MRGSRLRDGRPGWQPPENLVQQVAVLVQPSLQPLRRGPVDVALIPEVSPVLVHQADRVAIVS